MIITVLIPIISQKKQAAECEVACFFVSSPIIVRVRYEWYLRDKLIVGQQRIVARSVVSRLY